MAWELGTHVGANTLTKLLVGFANLNAACLHPRPCVPSQFKPAQSVCEQLEGPYNNDLLPLWQVQGFPWTPSAASY